jgi:hypothetical protein
VVAVRAAETTASPSTATTYRCNRLTVRRIALLAIPEEGMASMP